MQIYANYIKKKFIVLILCPPCFLFIYLRFSFFLIFHFKEQISSVRLWYLMSAYLIVDYITQSTVNTDLYIYLFFLIHFIPLTSFLFSVYMTAATFSLDKGSILKNKNK